MDSSKYFVILCDQDDNFCTVPQEDIVSKDGVPVEEGDHVTFFWSSQKVSGEVHHIGEDFGECLKVAYRLTSERKKLLKRQRDGSFHAGSPRKAKKKCVEKMNGNVGKKLPTKTIAPKTSSKQNLLDLKANRLDVEQLGLLEENKRVTSGSRKSRQLISSDSDDDDPTDKKVNKFKRLNENKVSSADKSTSGSSTEEVSSDSDSSGRPSTSAAKQLKNRARLQEKLQKLASKLGATVDVEPGASRRKADDMNNQDLLTISKKNSNEKDVLKKETIEKDQCKNQNSDQTSNRTSDGKQGNKNSSPGNDGGKRSFPYNFHVVASRPFTGQMYRHNELSQDCVELVDQKQKGSGIFCNKDEYDLADSATTATMVARRLLEGVFTLEALQTCSLTGLPPRGKGKTSYSDPASIKPHLCPKGTKAIIEQSLEWQKSKYMRPKKDAAQVRSSMSVKLCDFAPKDKNKA